MRGEVARVTFARLDGSETTVEAERVIAATGYRVDAPAAPAIGGDYWAAVEGFEIYVDEFNLRNLYDHVDVMDIRDYRWAEPLDLVKSPCGIRA